MLMLRSVLFSLAFYLSTFLQMIFWTPFYFTGTRQRAWWFVRFWAKSTNWLLRVICGTHHDVRGVERLPQGAYIVAPKHQSAWDTMSFLPWIPDPVYILKRELMWIPIFGWYVSRMKMVPIDRGSREKAIAKVNAGAKAAMTDGRQILIYPEGTRRAPGAEPAYKSGIAYLYLELGVPVVPIAHNAGLYWPKNKWVRYPGLIEAEFLEPIQPGLTRDEFMKELIARTEAGCDRLLLRASERHNAPPLPPTAIKRLAEMRAKQKPD